MPNRIATGGGVGICALVLAALGHAPAPLHGQGATAEEGAYREDLWGSLESVGSGGDGGGGDAR